MKSKIIVVATTFACAFLFGTAVSAAAAPGDPSRAELTRAVIQKWAGHVDKTYPIGASAWSVEMAPAFASASMEELKAAADAKNFDTMNALLLGGEDGTNALGDTAADLVYVPVTPCRLFDTRLAGGKIAANTTRGFDVTAAGSYTFQGGSATDCGVGAAGSFAAAQINFTVVAPEAPGYITAFPFLTTQPLASTANYVAGTTVANDTVVKLDQGGSSNELNVYSFAATHVVGDIVGYYIAPAPTALQCEEQVSAGAAIAAGSFGTQSTPSCTAGYTITGGGCSSTTFDGRVVTTRTQATSHFCAFRNEGAASMTGTAYATCCRVPGR